MESQDYTGNFSMMDQTNGGGAGDGDGSSTMGAGSDRPHRPHHYRHHRGGRGRGSGADNGANQHHHHHHRGSPREQGHETGRGRGHERAEQNSTREPHYRSNRDHHHHHDENREQRSTRDHEHGSTRDNEPRLPRDHHQPQHHHGRSSRRGGARDGMGQRSNFSGFRGGGGGGRGAGAGHHLGGTSELNSKTLIITDADNEFLRMLTQAKERETSNETIIAQLDSRSGANAEQRQHLSRRMQQAELTSMQASRQASKSGDQSMHKACPVCLMDSPSLTGELVQAVTSCEHIYCFECALRLIFITDKSDCPICRQTLSKVVLTRAESLDDCDELKPFLASSERTHKLFKNFAKMVFFDATESDRIFDLIKQLLWFNCTFCKKVPYSFHMYTKNQESYEAIAKHLRKHDRNLCDLCFFNLELFPYEYELYTNYEMDMHKRQGSIIGEAQVHHRMCHLCPDPGYFFDNEALSTHCKQAHISCYVCTSQTIFFVDQPSLIDHVAEQHIVCPACRRLSGQVIGFLSVIELKSHAHVEHPAEKIDYDKIAKEAIMMAQTQSMVHSSGGGGGGGSGSNRSFRDDIHHNRNNNNDVNGPDANMSRREAFDRIDDLLRNRYSTERRRNPPAMMNDPEMYSINFPTMSEGAGVDSQSSNGAVPSAAAAAASLSTAKASKKGGNSSTANNVILFPAKHRIASSLNANSSTYGDHFPELSGGGGDGNVPGGLARSVASAASRMKNKPQNWQQSNQKNASSKASLQPQPSNEITIKPGKKKGRKPPPPSASSSSAFDAEDGPVSIYDGMILTDPLKESQTIGQTKPATVQLIEAIPSTASTSSSVALSASATAATKTKGPPAKEAFPALGRSSANPANPAGISGIWSATAHAHAKKQKQLARAGFRAEPAPAAPPQSELESRLDSLNINSDFPTLGGSGSGGPSWQTGCRWAPAKPKKKAKAPKKNAPDANEWQRPEV